MHFLLRWQLRRFRRQLNQTSVLVALVTVAVALAVGSVVAAYNLAQPPERTYGLGDFKITVEEDAAVMQQALVDQGLRFGVVETAVVPLPGTTQQIELRSQRPDDEVASPLIETVAGRLPTELGEIALTDGSARQLDRTVGDSVTIAGRDVEVVGLVENPTDLDDEFVLLESMDEFGVGDAVSTAFLVGGSPDGVEFPAGVASFGVEDDGGFPLDLRTFLALLVNLVASVALLEVALLIGAGFAIMMRRNVRSFGLVAAIGATPQMLRRAATLGGLVIGSVGSIVGAAAGLTIAAWLVPSMETAVGHRIDFGVPWWTVLPTVLVASVVAGLAGWWPSRSLTRRSITSLLAALRPTPTPAGRSWIGAVVITSLGVTLMVVGVRNLSIALSVAGVIASLAGLLLLAPITVRAIGRAGGRFPLAGRMASRSIARQQGRSSAVVAALVLALGVPIGVAVGTASYDQGRVNAGPNLPDNAAVLWLPGAELALQEIPADLDAAGAEPVLADIESRFPDATIAPIQVAVSSDADPFLYDFGALGTRRAVIPEFAVMEADPNCNCDLRAFGDVDDAGNEIVYTAHDAWIGTDELTSLLGIDSLADVGGSGITRMEGAELRSLRNTDGSRLDLADDYPEFGTYAGVLIDPETLDPGLWDIRTIGWIIADSDPLTIDDREAIRTAAGSDLGSEFLTEPTAQSNVRAIAMVVGSVVGSGILLAVASLAASEAAPDLRTLRAVGAGPRTSRRISAMNALLLALAGAVVAVPAGYLVLVAMVSDRSSDFPMVVPWSSVGAALIGFPAVAAGFGWTVGRSTATQHRSGATDLP